MEVFENIANNLSLPQLSVIRECSLKENSDRKQICQKYMKLFVKTNLN